ncbi:unnamed protein product [Tilletia controversa]|nr:hypothetical protein CF328_g2435 [Tilletia controversa]CAD6983551.1 unnamed protein product [Tilletia controversa]
MPTSSVAAEAAVDPKAILGARLLGMLLQEVVLDVAVRAHGLVSAERREAASLPSSSPSSSPPTATRIPVPTASPFDSSALLPGQTGDEGAPMEVDDKGVVGEELVVPAGVLEPEDGEVVEESVCANCGKADCVGASGAVDCPDPSGGTPSQANGSSSQQAQTSSSATTTTATTTTIKPDLYSHNPLYECLVCSRQVAANRYATHLANCLGIGAKASSSRKVANRGQKIANILENRRKATALVPAVEGPGSGGGVGRAGTPGMGSGQALFARGGGGDSRQSTPAVGPGGGYGGDGMSPVDRK